MPRYTLKDKRPFISVSIIILTLFFAAFFKITVRRISYALYQESKEFDKVQDRYYENLREYSRLDHSMYLEDLARKSSLDKMKKGQIIQVINGKAAISY